MLGLLSWSCFGVGLAAVAPERMHRLSWTCVPIGAFAIVAPWAVTMGHTATHPMIWSNAFAGGAACLFGLMESGTVLASRAPPRARKTRNMRPGFVP